MRVTVEFSSPVEGRDSASGDDGGCCSPDLNPSEQVFAKLKHRMRNAAECTIETT